MVKIDHMAYNLDKEQFDPWLSLNSEIWQRKKKKESDLMKSRFGKIPKFSDRFGQTV